MDGSSLRKSWYNALDEAQATFRRHLQSASSSEWKRVPVPVPAEPSIRSKGKSRSILPELTDVHIHRKAGKNEEATWRCVLELPTGSDSLSLDAWKSVLSTPELRKEWDPAVESAQLVEMFDPSTRVAKTMFTLGWPASPRDAVTISRTFNDANTVIEISTSLPRSPDEPTYLRPNPPYVRSHVKLFGWCIQHISSTGAGDDGASMRTAVPSRLRITCFWQHDLRALFNFGSNASMAQQLASMVLGLFKTVLKRRARVPVLTGYGNGVSIERSRFDIDREALILNYSIIPDDEDHPTPAAEAGLEDLHALREHRRLTRAVEFSVPITEGWDVQIHTSASSPEVAQLPWTARAFRSSDLPKPSTSTAEDPFADRQDVTFRVSHTELPDHHSILKVSVTIELSGPSSGLRLNGIPHPVEMVEERTPQSYFMSQSMLQDATSTADMSFRTASSTATSGSGSVGSVSQAPMRPSLGRTFTHRGVATEKSILSRVRRNYIYFSSLLQEPEAKWRRTTEARGVSVTQLDSIDPTLVVYRAEATFVGLGIWDLFAAINSAGVRSYWDKQHESATLLEDVNELSELWHHKFKPAWPVSARDAVLLKTVYKSPTTVHVFSFSADDSNLFPNIPPPDPAAIRMQVDLQGIAIEALSPTTTQLVLLEQSDPKGWTNKTSIPQQMISALAGVGEFTIRCGGPPTATRLAGAKVNDLKYDHERGQFKIEYEVTASRRPSTTDASDGADADAVAASSTNPLVELELRCDIDTWAQSLDIVVDPPPQSISCFRRHRLSAGGGGLWLSLTHDAVLAGDERLMAVVRRAPGRERGVVMVNGSRVAVDVEELPEAEIKSLSKQKRVKPARIPLDQPPVMGVIRQRRFDEDPDKTTDQPPLSPSASSPFAKDAPTAINTVKANGAGAWAAPRFPSPLSRYFTFAAEQVQQAVAEISPTSSGDDGPPPERAPMQAALEALSYVRDAYTKPAVEADGWTSIPTKGMNVLKRLEPSLGSAVPVHRGEKVIEGFSAGELAGVLSSYDLRKTWDDRFAGAEVLQTFGAGAHTAFVNVRAAFPFRDRGFLLATLVAADADTNGERPPLFIVSASCHPDALPGFLSAKYNPYNLPLGRMLVDAWVLETLDPYGPENYAIPSTRVTRFTAADLAGSIPAAVNSLHVAALARQPLALETAARVLAALPPVARWPAACVAFADRRLEGPAQALASWSVRRRDNERVLVGEKYVKGDRAYDAVILLNLPGDTAASAGTRSKSPEPAKGATSKDGDDEDGPPTARPVVGRQHSASVSSVMSGGGRHSRSSTGPGERTLRAVASTSAFTRSGEVKTQSDMLVAEIVVDSRLYPEGYEITLRSRILSSGNDGKGKGKAVEKEVIVLGEVMGEDDRAIPVAHAVHTLPETPLHAAGAPRHLVRLSLPTAGFSAQIGTVTDPLTGETRAPAPMPKWAEEMRDRGAVVRVEVRPKSGEEKGKEGEVWVDGKKVGVVGEKESLTKLGREELLDERAGKMTVFTRHSSEEEELPRALLVPLAHAAAMRDPEADARPAVTEDIATEGEEAGSVLEDGSEAKEGTSEDTPPTPHPPPARTQSGLFGFLGAYPNMLNRVKSKSTLSFTTATPGTATPSSSSSHLPLAPPPPPPSLLQRRYEFKTVLIVALLAFLIGSLLRSLISPADFVYDVGVEEDGRREEGWREIKRLFELKGIVGGWDLQVAVVRRH
ncbi:hypothetical protein PENSPDRAFT_604644 [Peniophora sp. CONT]|nr:hypothetical protein PENSPDRAFT_604644 [Peniophora sp. CONT]